MVINHLNSPASFREINLTLQIVRSMASHFKLYVFALHCILFNCNVYCKICADYGDYDAINGTDRIIDTFDEIVYVNLNDNYTVITADSTAIYQRYTFNCTNPNGCLMVAQALPLVLIHLCIVIHQLDVISFVMQILRVGI